MNFKDPKDPGESVVLEFDFSNELTSIVSVTVAVSVASGVDLLPANVLDGAPQIVGRKVRQRFSNGVSGVRYKFRVVAVSGSDRIARVGIAEVRTE